MSLEDQQPGQFSTLKIKFSAEERTQQRCIASRVYGFDGATLADASRARGGRKTVMPLHEVERIWVRLSKVVVVSHV